MFIQTEATPNPATMKFLPGQPVLGEGVLDIKSAEDADRSPLAARLFAVPGVTAVFLGGDFVTVTKSGDSEWQHIKPAILGGIMEHFLSGAPAVVGDDSGQADDEFYDTKDADVVAQIKELLDTRVRPAVANDGGDISFRGFKDGIVFVHMQGACSGCPSSTATLRSGVQNLLRHYVPEVVEVQPV